MVNTLWDGRGVPWEHDAGPPRNRSWGRLFAETPNYRGLGHAVTNRNAFRWHFGPMFYRGRLGDRQVKVLIVGQEGAQDESLSHRSFTGGTGGRMQHLLNRAAGDSGVTVLITARRPVADWGVALPDLVSRLNAAEAAGLKEPDDALLRQVLEKLFRDRRTPLSAGVLEYILTRMERSVDFARRLVAVLDNEALAKKGPVTRGLARDALAVLSSDDAEA
jgi:hypothetical protein